MCVREAAERRVEHDGVSTLLSRLPISYLSLLLCNSRSVRSASKHDRSQTAAAGSQTEVPVHMRVPIAAHYSSHTSAVMLEREARVRAIAFAPPRVEDWIGYTVQFSASVEGEAVRVALAPLPLLLAALRRTTGRR